MTSPSGKPIIRIIESDLGPLISESRSTVYDVMDAYDDGFHPTEIREMFNLSPLQVEVALDYIEEHREQLEPELKEILRKAAEREKYHRAIAEKIKRERPVEMTPRRAALYALIEKKRRERGEL